MVSRRFYWLEGRLGMAYGWHGPCHGCADRLMMTSDARKKGVSPGTTILRALTRKKPIEKGISQTTSEKTLGWYDLTAYGIAATVGSGIYVTCGKMAKYNAGPAVVFSTALAGALSLLTGICYLEFASSLPISGSGYAYFYTMLGEFLGWFIGWNLTLEYSFAAAIIAGGWTQYLSQLMEQIGWKIPRFLYFIPVLERLGLAVSNEHSGQDPQLIEDQTIFRINILAAIVTLLLGVIVSRGMKFGTTLTNVITMVNIGIILFILVVGSFYMSKGDPMANWSPFFHNGWTGVFQGTGEMFFSYIGYDTVSTLAGEATNPARDMPIAVFLTVGTATLLYMGVGLVLTGMQKYTTLNTRSPLAMAFSASGAPWASYVVSFCALFTMLATLFACLMGQPKIFQVIAKDGLLPRRFARENRHGVAIGSVAFTTVLTAVLVLFINCKTALVEMVSFGTLLGMSMLCAGLLVVRFSQNKAVQVPGTILTVVYFIGCVVSTLCFKHWHGAVYYVAAVTMGLPFLGLAYFFVCHGQSLASTSAAFSCPLMPILPCVAIAANSFFMLEMEQAGLSCLEFAIWTVLGLAIYFGYGLWHSHLNDDEETPLKPE